VERAKPQAATKFLSHAGENVSHKTRKSTRLKAFSFKYYQLITKLISINGEYFIYITLLLNAIFPAEYLHLACDTRTTVCRWSPCLAQQGYMLNSKIISGTM